MAPDEMREMRDMLIRIDERTTATHERVVKLEQNQHCESHSTRIASLESCQKEIKAKWWAAMLLIVGAWIKGIFFSG